MTATQTYIEQYAQEAMAQQRQYGIPASITLAQAILESGNGQSKLAKTENNHFGIKATDAWINGGGRYALYNDDKPNEKFCSYATVAESYKHHSQFLKNNARYSGCFTLSSDDYRGWANGLAAAGYASDKRYAQSLISIIEKNGLDKYDRIAMENTSCSKVEYAFPLKRNEFLLITSPFGQRQDPTNPLQNHMHKGIDILTDKEAVYATESNGKVVAVNTNDNTPGGKSITIEYNRADGDKIQINYAHLSEINIKIGDSVDAGIKLGVSGNTGTHSTSEHLHFGVKKVNADGTTRDLDPAAYLAEIAEKGNINVTAMHNGTDLLARYKSYDSQSYAIDTSLSAEDWMKKLLSSEDSGMKFTNTGHDPIMELVVSMFSSLIALAVQIDNKPNDKVTESVQARSVDLSYLSPKQLQCSLTICDNGTPIIKLGDIEHRLSTAEINRLNLILSDDTLSDEQKQQKVAFFINGISLNCLASQNYQQNISDIKSQSENLSHSIH